MIRQQNLSEQEEKALRMAIDDNLITGFYCEEDTLWCRWLNKETMREVIRFKYVKGHSDNQICEEKYLSR